MGLTRRKLLWRASATAAGILTGRWLLGQPAVQQFYNQVIGYGNPSSPAWSPSGYLHGCFSVITPAAVAQAAQLGINFSINYGSYTEEAADPNTPLGQAMQAAGMKTFLDVESLYLRCVAGAGTADMQGVRDLVYGYHQSPVVGGYWIKDDDCGYMGTAVGNIARMIRSIDGDRSHLIVAGYGTPTSLARNYQHGQADVLGFYLYGDSPYTSLVPMLEILRQRTPRGEQPPPILGMYQAYGLPPKVPTPSAQQMVSAADVFISHGVIGLCAFAWVADGMSHMPDNDASLRNGIALISSRLQQRQSNSSQSY